VTVHASATAYAVAMKYFPSQQRASDEQAVRDLCRAALVIAVCKLDPYVSAKDFMQRRWPGDEGRAVETVVRAAVNPATTVASGWAAELTRTTYAFLRIIAGQYASGTVLARGIQIESNASITLPTVAPGLCSFVAEGAPIPVERFAASGPTVSPRKMAAMIELTHELMQSSNAESLIRAAMVESVGKNLDPILFDAQPGDAIRPPGLRYGVAGLTPATVPGSGEKAQALADDIIALASAVGAVVGGPLTFVAAIPQAMALSLRTLSSFVYTVLPSAALANGTVICIADAALATVVDGPPQIDASRQAELHRETSPGAINASGTMATPVGSVYQIDSTVLRLKFPISWCLRAAGISWMSSVNW
jgi:hypothetical protein